MQSSALDGQDLVELYEGVGEHLLRGCAVLGVDVGFLLLEGQRHLAVDPVLCLLLSHASLFDHALDLGLGRTANHDDGVAHVLKDLGLEEDGSVDHH